MVPIIVDQRGLLGSGAFSRVYRGHYRGRPAAIKFFVRLAEVSADTINVYTKETAIAAAVQHENIVHFYGLCVRPPTIFLIMELCSRGSLYGLLKKGGTHKWSLGRKLRMCLDACLGVQHLHKLGFIHRDLKSLNYLVTDDYRLKLTDFGLSRRIYTYTGSETMAMQNGEEAMVPALGADDTLTTRVGTSLWMSPEMMTGQPYNGTIHSLITLFLLIAISLLLIYG
jgi:serine/threonine protein kinase